MKKIALLIVFLISSLSYNAYARKRASVGSKVIIEKVADLPNTDDYLVDDGTGNSLNAKLYLDLAIKYKIFGVGNTAFWVTQEPTIVGINNFNKEDVFYLLSDEEVDAIIKENNLNREALLELGIWKKHGGLIIVAVFIVIYLLYLKLSPKEKEDVIEYNNEETKN